MDIATLLGFIAGLGIVITAMLLGASVDTFVDIPSVLIVIGGSFSAVLMRFPMKACFRAMGTGFGGAFKERLDDPMMLIEKAKELADVARKKGLIALEEVEVENELMAKGVQYCADGRDADFIRDIMSKEINASIAANDMGEQIYRAWGDAAPAFGMIGTLVGLVQMLVALSDPASIGPAMAVALLTTLYGAMLANMMFLPIADKLAMRAQTERRNRNLIMDIILGINGGASPRVLEETLIASIPKNMQGKHNDAEDGAEGAAEAAA